MADDSKPPESSLDTRLSSAEINKLSYNQVWNTDDSIICIAASASWTSKVYDHYDLSMERIIDDYGERCIRFKFTCKTDPKNHSPQYRARKSTSSGTNSLKRTAEACDKRSIAHKLIASGSFTRPFSAARFRAILALWCARNHRPFELVRDELFGQLLDELRSGTIAPNPSTLSWDVQAIYQHNMDAVRQYFMNIDYVHLAIDGWTAPTSRSFLGVVVIWQQYGQLRRAVLEFLHLKQSHTGVYLAKQTAECLKKYQLGQKLLTVCMDNAKPNETFTEALRDIFPTFGGAIARTRCGAHIVNLMAKAYLNVFFATERRKRIVKKAPVEVPQPKRQRNNDITPKAGQPGRNISSTRDDSDNESDTDSEAEDIQDAIVEDNLDQDKVEHDNATVKASIDHAFIDFEKDYKIKIPSSDRRVAEQIIPKASKRAHKSTVVQQRFEEYVSQIPTLNCSQRRALARRMVTRWNTDLECIRSHVYFQPAVKLLTADRDLSLKKYELNDDQWRLAERLSEELKIFERLTKLFSETQVPSIHQVIPVLLKLRDRLVESMSNAVISPLLRVAAKAALDVFEKYMQLFTTSGVYWIAVVMCPFYKLEWFKSRKYSQGDIEAIKSLAQSMFDWMCGHRLSLDKVQEPEIDTKMNRMDLFDDWLSDDEETPNTSRLHSDTIEAYLNSNLVSKETIRQGGLLKYWEGERKRTPRLAAFALGILTAPASSVDAERAFSGGRLTINHLQHSMSELTFEAKMAVGSWYQTPLLPSVDTAASILASTVRD
ncbi:AC transposase [Ceratobasidium sp. AG-Ba]|nr:AC transposase [Ceratobasidium sp. AG-Ba]QRW07659.1 AC transposase [Ceratobasidium sp. AG-Ba]